MEWLREWAMAVCSAAVFGAAITLLAPDDRYEKLVNTCVTLFVLAVAVSPIASMRSCTLPEFNEAAEQVHENTALEQCIELQAERCIANAAQELLCARLSEEGIIAEEISVTTDSSENGCISIGQVTITLQSEADSKKARGIAAVLLGTENIQIIGGSDG